MTLLDRQKELAGYLVEGGWPLVSACASVGNATVENQCLPVTTGRKDHGSDGLYQWRLDRLTGPKGLHQWAQARGLPWDTIKTQAAFHMWEVADQYPTLEADLRAGVKPIETLTANICVFYERPNMALAHLDTRISHAKSVYLIMSREQQPVVPAPVQTVEPMPVSEDALDVLDALRQRIIDFRNAKGMIQNLQAVLASKDFTGPVVSPVNKGTSMETKPAISSTTMWGGALAVIGPAIVPMIDQLGPIVPPQYQPFVMAASSIFGGLLAIYGRTNANVKPISGIIRSK